MTRRVLERKDQSPRGIVFEVERFGRAKPARFEFLRPDSLPTPARISREQFKVALRRIPERDFADGKLQLLSVVADGKNSFSRLCVRRAILEQKYVWGVLGARPGESTTTIKNRPRVLIGSIQQKYLTCKGNSFITFP